MNTKYLELNLKINQMEERRELTKELVNEWLTFLEKNEIKLFKNIEEFDDVCIIDKGRVEIDVLKYNRDVFYADYEETYYTYTIDWNWDSDIEEQVEEYRLYTQKYNRILGHDYQNDSTEFPNYYIDKERMLEELMRSINNTLKGDYEYIFEYLENLLDEL